MVDIVVVTYNALENLKACLKSIERYTKSSSYRLYIVDNASSDGTKKFLSGIKAKNVQSFFLPKNLGFSGAANWVTSKLRSPYVAFLDDDVFVTKNWLPKLLSTAKKSKKIGMVGCKLVYPSGKIFYCEARLGPIRTLFAGDADRGQGDYTKEVDLIAGACFLMPLQVLKEIGPFDERFFPCQAEDWDYCLRVREAGYKIIYNGLISVWHNHLYRAGGSETHELNKKRFLKKWGKKLDTFPRPDSHIADRIMSQAIAALKKEQNQKAINLSNKLKTINPKLVEPWVPSLAYVRMKNYKAAVGLLQEMIARNPDNYSARNYLTLCLRKLGRKEAAEEFTNKMFHCIVRNINSKRSKSR